MPKHKIYGGPEITTIPRDVRDLVDSLRNGRTRQDRIGRRDYFPNKKTYTRKGVGKKPFTGILGAHFDGSSAISIAGQPTGVADSKVGTFAARVRPQNVDAVGSKVFIDTGRDSPHVVINGSQELQCFSRNSSGALILNNSTAGTLSNNVWYNILLSWDLLNDAKAQMFVNDTDDAAAAATFTDDTIDYTFNGWAVGQVHGGAGFLKGDLPFVWFDPSRAIDFSVEANRRAFFGADGSVVLDPNGNGTALGGQPLLYFSGRHDKWHINKGSAGGTWTVTGQLKKIGHE